MLLASLKVDLLQARYCRLDVFGITAQAGCVPKQGLTRKPTGTGTETDRHAFTSERP